MGFFNKIPIVGGFLPDSSAKKAGNEIQAMQARLGKIALPDLQNFTPEELEMLGVYSPEQAMYQTYQEDPRLRGEQMSALSKLAGLADRGLSSEDELGLYNARQMGNQMAKGREDAAIQNAQARGVAGSGLEFAMRQMGNQEAAQRSQQAALEGAAQQARQRALYSQAYMDSLGQQRSQDAQVGQRNTDIINQFNQMNTQQKNAAQLRNLGEQQRIRDTNVGQRNDAFRYNNDLRQQQFGNKMAKVTGQNQASKTMADHYYAQSAADAATRNELTKAAMGAMGMGV